MNLVLASQSRARAQLLTAAGYRFRQAPSAIPEPPPGRGVSLTAHLRRLARAKAAAVAPGFPHAWIVAADTALIFEGKLIGKPRSAADAVAMLGRLAGHTHRLTTAICVMGPAAAAGSGRRRVACGLDTARVTLRDWSRDRIRRHVANVHPLNWAGAYALQEPHSAAIVRSVTGDPGTVIGLPLDLVDDLLAKLGYPASP